MKFKYIKHSIIGFIIWPCFLDDRYSHQEMAIPLIKHFRNSKVLSAGFVTFDFGKIKCFGNSQSLKIAAKDTDSHDLQYLMETAIYDYSPGPKFKEEGMS